MSTTDDSFSVTHEPLNIQRLSLKERWWHIMDTWKIGIIPLPMFLLAGALIAIDCLGGKLPSDIVVMVATLAFFGFACGEFGKRLPIVGKLGGRRNLRDLYSFRVSLLWSAAGCGGGVDDQIL
ncbi:Citrate/malate-proton symporter [Citrobacter koseri]|nr:Citrate/malate-proton symporter [Citrobacter koseri]